MCGYGAVVATVEEERAAAVGVVVLYLADKDHVVASFDTGDGAALEPCHRAVDQGQACDSLGEVEAGELVVCGGILRWRGELPREVVLVGGEDIDREVGGEL